MMRKFLSLLLAVMLSLSFMCGCGSESEEKEEREEREESALRDIERYGGTIVVFEPKDVKGVSQIELETAEAVLRDRLDDKNLQEATTSIQGDTGIRVEIPDMDNPEEALASIGDIAKLEFRYRYTNPNEDGSVRYETAMEGSNEYISSAKMEYGPTDTNSNSTYHVVVNFTSKGRDAFSKATTNAYNQSVDGEAVENVIAIVLDDSVISEPVVSNGPITDDSCVITGDFDADEASRLASVINSGSLPFALEATEMRTVKPRKR